jgi:hypothetical protein
MGLRNAVKEVLSRIISSQLTQGASPPTLQGSAAANEVHAVAVDLADERPADHRACAAGLAELYHDDAINHQVTQEPVEGREAIRVTFEREFATAEMVCIVKAIHRLGQEHACLRTLVCPTPVGGCRRVWILGMEAAWRHRVHVSRP